MWTQEQRDAQAAKVRGILKILRDYYIKNNLDPAKNWFKDPIHGSFITKWTYRLWKERDKIQAQMGEIKFQHILTRKKQIQMAKKEKKDLKKKKVVKEEKEVKKVAAKKARTAKYDYPLVDGKEMTAAQKKKYRAEQRKLKEDANKPVQKKKVNKSKEETAPSTKSVKENKKKNKSKKKHHKEED